MNRWNGFSGFSFLPPPKKPSVHPAKTKGYPKMSSYSKKRCCDSKKNSFFTNFSKNPIEKKLNMAYSYSYTEGKAVRYIRFPHKKTYWAKKGYVCEMCGTNKQLNFHHVNYETNEGIILCDFCHAFIHGHFESIPDIMVSQGIKRVNLRFLKTKKGIRIIGWKEDEKKTKDST